MLVLPKAQGQSWGVYTRASQAQKSTLSGWLGKSWEGLSGIDRKGEQPVVYTMSGDQGGRV